MQKFKNRLSYIKSVVIADPKTGKQEIKNIAPGGELSVSDEELALSHGFRAIVEAGQFMLVSAQAAPAPTKPVEAPKPAAKPVPAKPAPVAPAEEEK